MTYLYDQSGNVAVGMSSVLVPPQITGQPVKRVAPPGEIMTFSVVVADARGVTFQWKFNGADIPGATGDSLLLSHISDANVGQYSVVATNSAGSVTSEPAELLLGPIEAGSPRPQLAIYSRAGGYLMVSPMKLSYEPGETVSLTAIPFPPAVFIGWAKDLSGDANPASLTMDRNKTVRARFAATVPIPPGLIAAWRGETDASDLLGGHHGDFFAGAAITAPTITASGKVGRAFNFDGTVHVRVPGAAALKPAQVTLEAWVFPTGLSGDHQTVIACGSSTNNNHTWYLGVSSGGYPWFWTQQGILEGPSPVPLNEWTHLAATFDGVTKRLYVNGAAAARADARTALVYDAVPVTIGADWGSNAPVRLFHGRIDEAAIYGRALAADEVADIYNADYLGKNFSQPYFTSPAQWPDGVLGANYARQLTTVLGAAPVIFSLPDEALPAGMTLSSTGLVGGAPDKAGIFDFTVRATDAAGMAAEQMCGLRVLQPVAPPADLVAWWPGEPAAGGAALDIIGGHNGAFFSGAAAAPAAHTADGKVGSAFTFDGTVYVRVPDAVELRPPAMTVEGWIFPTVLNHSANFHMVMADGSSTYWSGAWYLGLYVFGGMSRFNSNHAGVAALDELEGPSPVPLNEWTHLAATFDGTTKRLYVNGVEVAQKGGLGALVYGAAPMPMTIGATWVANAPVQHFNGQIDEVSFYRRALSAAEIFSLADAGAAGKRTI